VDSWKFSLSFLKAARMEAKVLSAFRGNMQAEKLRLEAIH
jgi:hypothetical protein